MLTRPTVQQPRPKQRYRVLTQSDSMQSLNGAQPTFAAPQPRPPQIKTMQHLPSMMVIPPRRPAGAPPPAANPVVRRDLDDASRYIFFEMFCFKHMILVCLIRYPEELSMFHLFFTKDIVFL